MPFVTSKIYQNLVNYDGKELMVSTWPELKKNYKFENEEEFVEKIKQIIVEIRNVRANMNVHPSKKAELIFVTKRYEDQMWEAKDFILKLGFGEKICIQKDKVGIKQNAISIIQDDIELYMPFEGLVDIEEESKRLQKEKEKLESEVARCEKMLSNPGFVNKAPKEKVQEEEEKLNNYKNLLKNVSERIEKMK